MTASVQIFPSDEKPPPTFQELAEALRKEGVIFGVDEEAIARAIEAEPGKSTIVAKGQAPKPGIDAEIQMRESITKKAPKLLADGSVDFKDLQLVKNVLRGQILAEKEPPIAGLPGTDVRGVPIPAPEVRNPDLLGGDNTALTPDGLKVVSLIDGHLTVEKSPHGQPIPGVSATFILKKHVGVDTGNIDCIGNCEIAGGIQEGFQVIANGDIHVKGLVEGAEVISRKGSVILDRGIKGQIKGKVFAAKNITARFVENATLEADGDIIVNEHIYHSKVRCGGSVKVIETPGAILGGEVSFTGKLFCRDAGSEGEPKTVFYFGDWRAVAATKRAAEIDGLIAELNQQMEMMREYLKRMRRLTMENPDSHAKEIEELAQLAAPFANLKQRADALAAERAALAPHLAGKQYDPIAEIVGTIHVGVLFVGDGVEEAPIRTLRRSIQVRKSVPEKGMLAHFLIKQMR